MESDTIEHPPPSGLSLMLLKLPLVAHYRRVRGLSYVICWLHRLTGVALVGFCFFHVFTLQSLKNPAVYDAKMRIFSQPLFTVLEWGLSFPVMFHVLNGGRLILYESFGYRNDETSLRWTAGLLFLFCGIQAVLMIDGSQSVSATFYWLLALATAVTLVYRGVRQIGPTAHALTWKLQRLSGLFLLIMVPAHLVFMHLNPAVARDASTVLARIQNPLVKLIDIALVVGVFYHGACGLISIAGDYVANRWLRVGISLLVAMLMIGFGIIAIRLIGWS